MISGEKTFKAIDETIKNTKAELKKSEISTIISISAGTATVSGLENVKMAELLEFEGGVSGMVQTLDRDSVGVVFINKPDNLKAGDRAKRTNRVLDVPVGDNLLGRVVNSLGEPLDGKSPIVSKIRRAVEVDAYAIMDRAPVDEPLQTGIKAIDAFTPIGRGQRELILGDRQTGKTAIAVDAIINQKNSGKHL